LVCSLINEIVVNSFDMHYTSSIHLMRKPIFISSLYIDQHCGIRFNLFLISSQPTQCDLPPVLIFDKYIFVLSLPVFMFVACDRFALCILSKISSICFRFGVVLLS